MSTAAGPENAIYDSTTDQRGSLGQRMSPDSERVFRYARNGTSALAAGTLVQAAQQESNHSNLAVASAAAVGKYKVTVTNGNVLIPRDKYKEGYLYINDAAGQGYFYRVEAHPKAEIAASCVVSIKGTGIVVALTTSSEATLVMNTYDSVVTSWKEPSDAVVGVAPVAVAANEYFWCQTWGPAAVLQEGTLFPGKAVSASRKISGAVSLSESLFTSSETQEQAVTTHAAAHVERNRAGEATAPTLRLGVVSGHPVIPEVVVGHCIDSRADTEYALVYLNILN